MSVVEIYTDGGCREIADRLHAGWGVHIVDGDRILQGRGDASIDMDGNKYPVTNNVGELRAFIEAAKKTLESGWKSVTFNVDSQYVIKGTEKFVIGWEKNGWITTQGTEVKNKPLWEIVIDLKAKLNEAGVNWSFKWVKGHSGIPGNEAADALATAGITFSTNGMQDLWETKSPEEPKKKVKVPAISGLVLGKRWIFVTDNEEAESASKKELGGLTPYMFADFEDNDELAGKYLGKPNAAATYSIVATKENIAYLDLVKETQNKLSAGKLKMPVMGQLDKIHNKKNLTEIVTHDANCLGNSKGCVSLWNDAFLTRLCSPALLSSFALRYLNSLWDRLVMYKRDGVNEDAIDITDELFKKNDKGKYVLHDFITSQTKAIKVKLGHIDRPYTLTLTLGIDIPARNELNRLAKQSTESLKVYVQREQIEARSFRHYQLIESDGDLAIYQAVHSAFKPVP